MYCIKCGEKQNDGASFCHHCGAAQKDQKELASVPHKDLVNEFTREVGLKLYVGDKAEYYFNKWGLEQGEIVKTSWNTAAFFLGIFWLGYRKMYSTLVIILLIWIGLDAIFYALEIYHAGIDYLIGIVTAAVLGLKGNYLYYLQANKRVGKLSSNGTYSKEQLVQSGGKSKLGIFISIGLSILYMIISVYFILPKLSTEVIEFGFDEIDAEIVQPSEVFEPNDEMFYSFYFPDMKGGSFMIVIEDVMSSTSSIYDQWDDEVPPDWLGVTNSMIAPSDEGEYLMKVIKNNKVVAKGTFYVVRR
ncbi:DUF2628 domain-containing protein [Litchfieldia alkalitelluris]|uniref:DUF2628 domain-containing protein n=1 Tax=Litchfieldia alkalitelluris TaxID=304268 RepID=UPI0014744DDC|nr:DUF2628 domain-containing protein [Litchfieldia alkalitelluris]